LAERKASEFGTTMGEISEEAKILEWESEYARARHAHATRVGLGCAPLVPIRYIFYILGKNCWGA
jgi:hypothetical protein